MITLVELISVIAVGLVIGIVVALFIVRATHSYHAPNDDDNIKGLIQDFSRVIKYGDDFINQAGRPVIRIPWAGDCANMVILPKSNENIKDAKCYYPARGAHDWLSRYDENLEE